MKQLLCVFSFYGLEACTWKERLKIVTSECQSKCRLAHKPESRGKSSDGGLRAEFPRDRCEGNASLLSTFSVLFEVHWYLKLYNSLFQILKSFIFCKLLLLFLFFSQNLRVNKIMVPVDHMLVSMLAKNLSSELKNS